MSKKVKIITIFVVLINLSFCICTLTIKQDKNIKDIQSKKEEVKQNLENDILIGETRKSNNERTNLQYEEVVELNEENCEFETEEIDTNIIITQYDGTEESIIIPTQIGEKKVKKIDENAFKDCYNLETIKIPVELKDEISQIENFEINEESSDDKYIELKTTREYSEAYIAYMNQSEEERNASEIIPNKFDVPLEEVYSEKMEKLYGVSTLSETEMESSYDLRNHIYIEVENQGSHGTCYAYATLTAVETNIALKRGEIVDFSEVHAGGLTTGYKGDFNNVITYYNSDIGPVYEEDWDREKFSCNTNRENFESINKYLEGKDYTYEDETVIQEVLKRTKQVEKDLKYVALPSINYEDKEEENLKETVEKSRLMIKKHIKQYGAIYAVINADGITYYNGNCVLNYEGDSSNHAVCIVGWDDNFSKENFPVEIRPNNDGAYLVLNSWRRRLGR